MRKPVANLPAGQRRGDGVTMRQPRAKGRPDRTDGYKALMALSANLPEPPSSYAPDKYYRIQLTHSVEFSGHWLRPCADVVVKGSYAETIAEFISGAQEVRALG